MLERKDAFRAHRAIGLLSLIGALIGFLILALALEACSGHQATDMSLVEAIFAAPPADFKPEAPERAMFLLAIASFPLMLLTFNVIGLRLLGQPRWLDRHFGNLLAAVVLGAAGFGTYVLAQAPFFWQASLISLHPILCAAAVGLLALAMLWRRHNLQLSRGLYRALCVSILLPVAGFYLVGPEEIQDSSTYALHFNAVFHSVVQVYLGKALLIDFSNQYGLYPHFLAPLLHLLGLSIYKFSLVMAGLVLVAYASLGLFLERTLRSRLLAFVAFAGVVFFSSAFSLILVPEDRYFQYVPIRFVFPAVGILMASIYVYATRAKAKQLAYWSTHLLCSVGVLWNFDSGVVLFLAWILLLLYLECCQRNLSAITLGILKQGAAALAVFAGVIMVFSLTLLVQHGAVPDFLGSASYQKFFYLFGFYMLPMPLLHPWNLVALVYLAGLAYAIQAMLGVGSDRNRAAIILFISLLGIGLFSYYQGRSHDFNLIHVLYPAILLLALYLDGLQTSKWEACGDRWTVAGKRMARMAMALLLAIPCTSLLANLPNIITIAARHARINTAHATVTRDAEKLARQLKSQKTALMLSFHSGVYHLYSRTASPLGVPGMSELLLLTDHQKISEFLMANHEAPVVLDETLFTFGYPPVVDEHLRTLYSLYEPLEAAPVSNPMVLRRRATPLTSASALQHPLGGHPRELFYAEMDTTWPLIRIQQGDQSTELQLPNRLALGPLKTGPLFTIEMLVKPKRDQVDHATLISTHPGLNDHEGFVAHQEGATENDYVFGYGSGTCWEAPLRFTMTPDAWHYLAMVSEGKRLSLYVNDTKVGSVATEAPIQDSDMPLVLGDWIKKSRPFNGEIKAVAISGTPLSDSTIAENWQRIRQHLGR